jgi:hypothetical protein
MSSVKYITFLFFLLLFSCDKSPLFVTCSDCTKDEPKNAVIEIKADDKAIIISSETIVRVYYGNLEDSVLLATYTASASNLTYTAYLNKKYTITATYLIKNSTYTVVDSVYPRVKYDSNSCTEPCYYVYDKKVNLKLKYTGI